MEQVRRALVVGTGIGGATAACALQKAGIEVHAIDIKPETARVGTGICLLGNTLRALGTLGLEDECVDKGFALKTFREFDSAGNLQKAFPTNIGCGMRRPDLAQILESAAERAGARLEKGVKIERLKDDGDLVHVEFSNGCQGAYDVVVAADGAYSKLRAQVFGSEYQTRFAGQSVWRFSAPRPAELDGFSLYRGADGMAVGVIPTSKESCYLFFLENSGQPLHMDDGLLDVLIRERLSAFSAPLIRDAVAQITHPSQVLFRPFDITLVPAPWHRGRVVLLGDSAHAPTPQLTSGGGMAVEDAVVLGESLAQHSSVPMALQAYSERRFPRVKTVFDTSYQLSCYEQDPLHNADKSAALLMQGYQFLAQPY
jgi:2-polyprenyl-6-methoxyphenol hydroxylase-like FAD-dependent oxidoreductase